MKTAILIFVTFLPIAAAAQQDDPSPGSGPPPATATVHKEEAAQVPAARPGDRRRRGSMVGYIEDGIIESHVRVRFDAGYHNEVPDRAEFFYAKCGCYRQLVGLPPYDPDAPGPGPGIVSDLNFQQLYFEGQFAIGERAAVFAEVPLRWIQPQTFLAGGPPGTFAKQSGLSDVRAGIKLAFVSDDYRAITLQVKGYLPTGDSLKGLGTDHSSIEPALLIYSKASDRVAIQSQLGVWLPIGGSEGVPTSSSDKFAGNVFFYGVGPSFEIVSTDRVAFAPVVELVGWRVLGGFQTGDPSDAGGTNIVNLKIGGRVTVDGRSSFYAGYGRALTSKAGWYDDILRLEFRVSF